MESTPLMKDEQPPPSSNPSFPAAPPGYQQNEYGPPPQSYPPPQQADYPPPAAYPTPQQEAYPTPQQEAYPPPQQPAYPTPQQPAYPPPQQPAQPGYQAPSQHNTTTVITQPVVRTTSVKFSDSPVQLRCNHCQQDIITHLDHTPGLLTWLIVGILFILGIWPCCIIPLFIDAVKDVNHVCPNCGTLQGSYKRIS